MTHFFKLQIRRVRPLIVTFAALPLLLDAQSSQQDFVDCVQSSADGQWGDTCTVPAGTTYVIGTPIVVGRSPLTIKGNGNSVIQRAPYTGPPPAETAVLRIPEAVTSSNPSIVTAVTIRDLRFDGNRQGICYSPGNCVFYGVPPTSYVDTWALNYREIEIAPTSQLVKVLIDNVTVVDAPGYGIRIRRGTYNNNDPVNVDIRNSFFGQQAEGRGCGYLSGVISYTDGVRRAATLPYNPVLVWNSFWGCGGGAISINSAVYAQIIYNTLLRNHTEFPHRSGGGQIYVQYSSVANTTHALIYGNTVNGDGVADLNYGGTYGLELEGAFHRVEENTLTRHQREGITVNGIQCMSVLTNRVTSNGGDDPFPLLAAVAIKADQRPMATDILISGNTIADNLTYGFNAWTGGNGVDRIQYADNINNPSLVYNNFGGNLNPASAPSTNWNPACGTLP